MRAPTRPFHQRRFQRRQFHRHRRERKIQTTSWHETSTDDWEWDDHHDHNRRNRRHRQTTPHQCHRQWLHQHRRDQRSHRQRHLRQRRREPRFSGTRIWQETRTWRKPVPIRCRHRLQRQEPRQRAFQGRRDRQRRRRRRLRRVRRVHRELESQRSQWRRTQGPRQPSEGRLDRQMIQGPTRAATQTRHRWSRLRDRSDRHHRLQTIRGPMPAGTPTCPTWFPSRSFGRLAQRADSSSPAEARCIGTSGRADTNGRADLPFRLEVMEMPAGRCSILGLL